MGWYLTSNFNFRKCRESISSFWEDDHVFFDIVNRWILSNVGQENFRWAMIQTFQIHYRWMWWIIWFNITEKSPWSTISMEQKSTLVILWSWTFWDENVHVTRTRSNVVAAFSGINLNHLSQREGTVNERNPVDKIVNIYGCQPKNRGFYLPNHPFVHRVWFSIIFTIHFGGKKNPPIFGSTPIFPIWKSKTIKNSSPKCCMIKIPLPQKIVFSMKNWTGPYQRTPK